MAPFKSCRRFSHFIKKLDTLERNHTDGKITRLVSFPVCQQVEARAPIYPSHTHEITADILPQAADTGRRQNNPKRAARTAGISRVTSQPSLRIVLWNKLRSFPKRRFHVSPEVALATV